MCPSMCPRVQPIARKEMSKMRPTTCARNPRRTSNQTLIDGWSFVDFKTQRESGRFGFQNAESTRSPPGGRQAGGHGGYLNLSSRVSIRSQSECVFRSRRMRHRHHHALLRPPHNGREPAAAVAANGGLINYRDH